MDLVKYKIWRKKWGHIFYHIMGVPFIVIEYYFMMSNLTNGIDTLMGMIFILVVYSYTMKKLLIHKEV